MFSFRTVEGADCWNYLMGIEKYVVTQILNEEAEKREIPNRITTRSPFDEVMALADLLDDHLRKTYSSFSR